MAHIEDRWFKAVVGPDGKPRQVKTEVHGKWMRYRVRYIAPDGRERSKSFPDRQLREAKAFLVSVESDKLRGSYIDPSAGRITFREYAEAWLKTHPVDETTRELMETRLRKHVYPHLGSRALASIKPSDIRAWDKILEGRLARNTRSVAFSFVRSVFAAAVDDERIAKNPCTVKSVKQPRPEPTKIVPWTPEQVVGIWNGMPRRYRLTVDLGSGSGMRQGEIFGLSSEDLDFEDGWLHIQRQIKIVRNRLVFGLPKNKRDRRVPMGASVAAALKRHMHTFPVQKVTLPWEDPFGDKQVTVPLLLTGGRGAPLKRNDFDPNVWHRALRSAEIEVCRAHGMHALRHFYASVVLDAGETINGLAEDLGHSDPAFTLRRYVHLMPSREVRTRKAIDEVFMSLDGLRTAWEAK